MTQNRPGAPGPARTEQPSPAARLVVTVKPLGTAEGTVPDRDARYLIATFGILGSVVSGTGGAVLTLRIDPRLASMALAELVLALAAVVLIAAGGRMRARGGRGTRDRKSS